MNAVKTLSARSPGPGATPRVRKSPGAIQTAKIKSSARMKARTRNSTQAAGDSRQKIMMALIPILGIVLVLAVKNPLKVSPTAPVQNTQPAVAAPPAIASVEIAWEGPPLYPPDARDPMRLPEPSVTSTPAETDKPEVAPKQTRIELVVSGILYSSDRPAAIVDTQLVHEGQQISGATVKKIERDGVEFEWNGQTWKQTVGK